MQLFKIIEILLILALRSLAFGTAINTTESTLRNSENEQNSQYMKKVQEAYWTVGANCESIIDRGFLPGIYCLDEAFLTKMEWMWGIFEIYCDKADGVGWTVIQRRGQFGEHENFNRTWDDYARGFGDLNGEFWFGNEWIHKLTSTFGPYELRVEMEDWAGEKKWAQYSEFQVSPKESFYKLSISGFTGTAGDALKVHANQEFGTYDRIGYVEKFCATTFGAGNWFNNDCFRANLNGLYFDNNEKRPNHRGIIWASWQWNYSLKIAKMMIRSKHYRSLNKFKSESEL